MTTPVSSYFTGEKRAGACLAVLGILLLGAAVFASDGRRALAVTVGTLAVIEIGIGLGLFLRTGPQVNRLMAQLDSDPPAFTAAEDRRMTRVQRNFVVVKRAEFVVGAAALLGMLALGRGTTLREIALGLLPHAVLLFGFDAIAERRGAAYLEAIKDGRAAGQIVMCELA